MIFFRFFTDVNRARPNKTAFYDIINFPINPQVFTLSPCTNHFFFINILTQVHAIDEVTVTENIEAQSDVVKSAKALSQGGVIFVSNIYFY